MLLNNIDAVIFDLDGTLINSLGIWHKIDIDYLHSKNLEVPNNLHSEIGHLSFSQTAHYFKDHFNIEDSVEVIMKTWNDMAYKFYSTSTPLKKGAKDFLEYLKSSNIKIGLATSNSQILLEAALRQNGVFDLFDEITLTSEVDKGKNHPDVYLLAAQKLSVEPSRCLVFEDILPAVKGAKAAQMKVIAVEDRESLDDKEEIQKLADNYILDFENILSVL